MKTICFVSACCCIIACNSNDKRTPSQDSFIKAELAKANQPINIPIESGSTTGPISSSSWNYDSVEDKMTSKSDYFASVDATEPLYFQSPYDGGVTATFVIRKSSKYGLDTYLKVTKGQFHGDYNNPTVLIRIDDAPAKRYSYAEPSDASSETIFIEGSSSLISKLKKAKKMLIEAQFYDNGTKLMEFDVHDLQWKH